jgi:fatty-acyl-CoA synthase
VSAADSTWPTGYTTPGDLADIEAVPLAQRHLPATTYEILQHAARTWPDRIAVTVLPDAEHWQEPTRRTFGELLSDVHRTANLLRDLGVDRRDAVALISPNCDELITATLAAELAGIAAPVNGGLATDHVAELMSRSGARVLISAAPELDEASWQTARHLAAAGVVDTILLLSPTGVAVPSSAPELAGATVGYLSRLATDCDDSRFHGAVPERGDLAALFHTGGTTGTPKLAAHTHANEVVDAWSIAANTQLAEDAVVFAGLPLFHVNALVVTLLAPLLRGQQSIWAGPLGYRDFALYANLWKIIAAYGINAMSAVPTVYAVLARCPLDADISSLRFALVGASALPDSVRKDFQSHTGIALLEGYGLTEATCASVRSFSEHPRPGSVGQRMPYQRIKAVHVDDEGRWTDLPAGEVGVLAISGPTVFPGYVVGRTAGGFILDGLGKLAEGWLDTGDLGSVDDDGFVRLTGRAKDLIIRGGHNIDPVQIEDALLAHPDVTGAAAVGRPDPHAGEVPVAYVTVSPGSTATAEELVRWAAGRIGERAAVPKAVHVLDALPVTAIGKPHKLPLRAAAAEDAIRGALAGVAGVQAVDAASVDGATVVTVSLVGDADRPGVEEILGRYTVTCVLENAS